MSGPATIQAWNPVNAALEGSAYTLAKTDAAELRRASAELVKLYEGNQRGYLLGYLATLIKNEVLQRRYQELATFSNVVRLLVDRTSTLGTLPVRVEWSNPQDQKLWDKIAEERMGDRPWDAVIPALARRTELCKTTVLLPTWDRRDGVIDLDIYTPNQIDVAYVPGNLRKTRPDKYRILCDEATDLHQVWDFSGLEPRVFVVDRDHREIDAGEAYDVRSADGSFLLPFTAFRTATAQADFFIWDGQTDLLEAQQFVNRCYTQLSVQLHFGCFKTAIASGSGWTPRNGEPLTLTMDPSEIVILPDPIAGETPPTLKFDGPASEGVIKALLETIGDYVSQAGAAVGLNPSAIRAKNEATSGYALQIESAALKSKHASTRTLARPPLRRVVANMRDTWNAFNGRERFSADGTFTVSIPDYGSGVTTREETDTDVLKMEKGIVSKRSLVLKHNPGITSKEIDDLLAASAVQESAMQRAQRLEILIRAGVLTKAEARTLEGLPELKAEAEKINPDRIQRAFLEVGIFRVDELRVALGFTPLGGDEGSRFVFIGQQPQAPQPGKKQNPPPAPPAGKAEPDQPAPPEGTP